MMSDRTVPVALAAIRALQPEALWLDALCIPGEEPERSHCLRSMGAIYAAAARVVAVLSPPCAPVLEALHAKRHADAEMLAALGNDAWISRGWTYQEAVNTGNLKFVAEGSSGPAVGDNFFSDVGYAIQQYRKASGIGAFELRSRSPGLDAIEDLIGDYQLAGYGERTAFQAMSAMDMRSFERPEDYFEALLGVIGGADDTGTASVEAAERFMQLCEAKSDFSFIYSLGARAAVPGRCWRPLPDRLRPILSWHSYGDGQSGSLLSTHLDLQGLCRMSRGIISADAGEWIGAWLGSDRPDAQSANLAEATLERLRQMGFTGCGEYIELERGYFFPQTADPKANIVAVATGVRWVHGAPGLLLESGSGPITHFRTVGVFVGPVPKEGETISIGARTGAALHRGGLASAARHPRNTHLLDRGNRNE
jgi:hypothetical protein